MKEQYHAPAQQEAILLHNSSAVIDVNKEIYAQSEIGLPAEDENYQYSVVGEVGLGDESNGTALSLMRAINKKKGTADLFVAGLLKNHQGDKEIAGGWVHIPADTLIVIGRKPAQEGEAQKISGKKLFGVEFPSDISRKHLAIKLSGNGQLEVEDSSKNGSRLQGNLVEQTGSETGGTQDEPLTPKPVEKEVSREDEMQSIAARIKEIEAGLSEADSLALWRYWSGLANKREAQQRGDGQDSYNQERVASNGYNSMSPQALAVAEEYRTLADRLFYLRETQK